MESSLAHSFILFSISFSSPVLYIHRNLKAAKVPKPEVDLEVKILIALKAQYKQASGVDWQAPSAAAAAAPAAPPASSAAAVNQKVVDQVS